METRGALPAADKPEIVVALVELKNTLGVPRVWSLPPLQPASRRGTFPSAFRL